MPALVERMAYVGDVPWWVGVEEGEARELTAAATAAEMIEAAGLGWTVGVHPLYVRSSSGQARRLRRIPHRCAVVRDDTGAPLGVVSDRYQPIQNAECFGFFDSVVGEGRALYHTAGAIQEGRKVWLLARLPESIKVNGVDQVDNYLLLMNAHDGDLAFRMLWTPIRVVCNNTLNLALRDERGYRLSHFTGIRAKMSVADAKEALGLAAGFMERFGQQAEVMAQTPISDEEIEGLMQRLFPLPKALLLPAPEGKPQLLLPEPKREDLMPKWQMTFLKRNVCEELIRIGKGNSDSAVAGTRWAAFNGVAEFADYCMGWDRTRTASLLFGEGQALKQRAWNLLQKANIAS